MEKVSGEERNWWFTCEGEQAKWRLEVGFGYGKGGYFYFLSWGKLERVKCRMEEKTNGERFKAGEEKTWSKG